MFGNVSASWSVKQRVHPKRVTSGVLDFPTRDATACMVFAKIGVSRPVKKCLVPQWVMNAVLRSASAYNHYHDGIL